MILAQKSVPRKCADDKTGKSSDSCLKGVNSITVSTEVTDTDN